VELEKNLMGNNGAGSAVRRNVTKRANEEDIVPGILA